MSSAQQTTGARLTALTLAVAVLAGACTARSATTADPASDSSNAVRTVTRTRSPAALPATNVVGGAATTFDRDQHSTTDPRSIWVVVNKTHRIEPVHYRPQLGIVRGYQVARPVAGPLSSLVDAASRRGVELKIASAFRSYGYQRHVHAALVRRGGQTTADAVSARAGFSEHQTGLAVDLVDPTEAACSLDPCFAQSPAGRWLASEAWRYGFIIRYTSENQAATGYSAEPWHVRFVGHGLAAQLRKIHSTSLEAYFGIVGGR